MLQRSFLIMCLRENEDGRLLKAMAEPTPAKTKSKVEINSAR